MLWLKGIFFISKVIWRFFSSLTVPYSLSHFPGYSFFLPDIVKWHCLCPKSDKLANSSPKVWFTYGDDTYVVIEKDKVQQFTDHMSNQNPHIKLTKDPERGNEFSFLDTLVKG